MAGSFGAMGGYDFGDFLGAIGQSLLSSNRYTPLAGVPGALQAAGAQNERLDQKGAMVAALKQAGFDDATAATMAANPEAAKLAVEAKKLRENQVILAGDPIFGGAGTSTGGTTPAPIAPPAMRVGGLGGMGGTPVPPPALPPTVPQPAPVVAPPVAGASPKVAPPAVSPVPAVAANVPAAGAQPVALNDTRPVERSTDAESALSEAGYGLPRTRGEAYKAALGVARRIALYDARGMKTTHLAPIMDHYLKLATPAEIEKQLDAAGLTGEARRQAILNSLSDNRPDVIKLGQAALAQPGVLDAGVKAEAARKGADTTATSVATAQTNEAVAARQGGRQAERIMGALNEAERAYKAAAAGGGTGPWAASGFNRTLAAAVPSMWGRENETNRQLFENAIATVQNAKSAVDLKGQGAVSNFERTLASADLPSLSSVDPKIATAAFARLRQQLETARALDAKLGPRLGEDVRPTAAPQTIATPYGTIRPK